MQKRDAMLWINTLDSPISKSQEADAQNRVDQVNNKIEQLGAFKVTESEDFQIPSYAKQVCFHLLDSLSFLALQLSSNV